MQGYSKLMKISENEPDPASMQWKTGSEIGGAERDRTAGLLVANEALSQLSYSPTKAGDTSLSLAVEG
jgi:hypothetical protein